MELKLDDYLSEGRYTNILLMIVDEKCIHRTSYARGDAVDREISATTALGILLRRKEALEKELQACEKMMSLLAGKE
jgi:hypothetical protein